VKCGDSVARCVVGTALKVKQDALEIAQAPIHRGSIRPRVIHSLPPHLFADVRFAGNSARMEGDRIARALARIEAASARIEAAAAHRAPADAALQARYDRLRSEAEHALVEVDALIKALES